MAPPPITPSPHRFLTSKQNNPTPKPSSSLRFQHPSTQPSLSQQFAPTPRFHTTFTEKTPREDVAPTTQLSSPLSWRPHLPPQQPVNTKEDIEEPSSDHEDAAETAQNDSLPAYPPSKRRRPNPLETEPIIISSSPPSPTSPPTSSLPPTISDANNNNPTPPPPNPNTTPAPHPPRFVLPSDPNPSPIPSRPPLILPPRPPTPPPAALPTFFSPQRRGQKYIPGGMAATVRDWIVEAGSQMAHNQRSHRDDGVWDTRIRISECVEGVGMLLVREWGEDGARGWVLVGEGRGEGGGEVGRMVGVREPVWEVEVGGEMWRVAVEWGVVDG